MAVEFEFEARSNRYRVIRKYAKPQRPGRSGQSLLELQVLTPEGVRSLSGNTQAETERKIIDLLCMEYETFVNSAFLRQGHADEFTVKPPGERKKVLADILALSFYEELKERARDKVKERERDEENLRRQIEDMEREVARRGEYEAQLQELTRRLNRLREEVEQQEKVVMRLREEKKALEMKQEQLTELRRNIQQREEERERWCQQRRARQERIAEYRQMLERRREVEQGYALFQESKKELEELAEKAGKSYTLLERKGALEKKVEDARRELAAEQRAGERKREELRAEAQRLPQLEEELHQLQERLSQLPRLKRELEERRQQHQEELLHLQQLKLALEQSRRETEELQERLTLLRRGDLRCPLCQTELGAEGKQRIEEKYEAEIKSRAESRQRCQEEAARKREQRQRIEQAIRELEGKLEELQAEQPRAATLTERIQQATRAATELGEVETRVAKLKQQLERREFALAEQRAVQEIEKELREVAYDPGKHEEVRQRLRELEHYERLWRGVEEAERSLPVAERELSQVEEAIARCNQELEREREREAILAAELRALPELQERLQEAETRYNSLQEQREKEQSLRGAAREKLERCLSLEKALGEQREALRQVSGEKKIYEELTQAFGKDGVQAFIIESVLPELEREANHLLSRMTDNRMHLRLETQRETREGRTLETLEIKIADELGTRSYEMYSGGEAFRINFALRIALSKLLARRAGAPLPTLIIDEGFGTQDSSGLDRLVEAIKSIESDFKKILVITHIEELKEAFPARIEVIKTERGSVLSVS
jgi:exonuclease SbcC